MKRQCEIPKCAHDMNLDQKKSSSTHFHINIIISAPIDTEYVDSGFYYNLFPSLKSFKHKWNPFHTLAWRNVRSGIDSKSFYSR